MLVNSCSGLTKYNADLLKYSCQIECRVKAVQPAKVSGPHEVPNLDGEPCYDIESSSCDSDTKDRLLSVRVLLSKPIIAFQFNGLKMKVEAPKLMSEPSQKT